MDLLNNNIQFTRKEILNSKIAKNSVGWIVKVPIRSSLSANSSLTNFSVYILTNEEYQNKK